MCSYGERLSLSMADNEVVFYYGEMVSSCVLFFFKVVNSCVFVW